MVRANGGEIVGEEYFPLDNVDFRRDGRQDHRERRRGGLQHHRSAGLDAVPRELHKAGFGKRGGKIICTYFDENFLNLVPPEQIEGLYSCLDYYQELDDPFSRALLRRYNAALPRQRHVHRRQRLHRPLPGLKMWEAAVTEAGTLEQDAVIRALDHARITEGPGGPAEMVPGQHHVRMNMYIAQAQGGRFRVVKNLGPIDPNERVLADELQLSKAG